MNFYDNAAEVQRAAEVLYENEQYRISVSNSCLAMELYLKSKLHLTEKGEDYAYSHDTINMYHQLAKRFKHDSDLLKIIKLGRKYFNESRYPHRVFYGDAAIYTKEFALEFLGYVGAVRKFIDDVCVADIEDLTTN